MKRKLLLLMACALLLIISTGCDMAIQTDGLASRKAGTNQNSQNNGKGPTYFEASVNLYQDLGSVVTEHKGNSNHYKTVEETLQSFAYGPFGGPVSSDWDLLDGKNVVMSNITNYNLDPDSGAIKGTNHSVINILDASNEVVAVLEANGRIDGSLLGAELTMNWVLKETSEGKINARGKVEGIFTWAIFNYEKMALEYILPNGTFKLSGTYN